MRTVGSLSSMGYLRKIVSLIYLFSLTIIISDSAFAADSKSEITIDLQLTFHEDKGCEAYLTAYIFKPPYDRARKQVSRRPFNLPKDQHRLARSLRSSGAQLEIANVEAALAVPSSCSGSALDAVRTARFRQVGFRLPPNSETTLQGISVCDVVANPERYRDQKMELYGSVEHTHSFSQTVVLHGKGCDGGLIIQGQVPEVDARSGAFLQVIRASFVGWITKTTWGRFTPTDFVAGIFFISESYNNAEYTGLCWVSKKIDNSRYSTVEGPCK